MYQLMNNNYQLINEKKFDLLNKNVKKFVNNEMKNQYYNDINFNNNILKNIN